MGAHRPGMWGSVGVGEDPSQGSCFGLWFEVVQGQGEAPTLVWMRVWDGDRPGTRRLAHLSPAPVGHKGDLPSPGPGFPHTFAQGGGPGSRGCQVSTFHLCPAAARRSVRALRKPRTGFPGRSKGLHVFRGLLSVSHTRAHRIHTLHACVHACMHVSGHVAKDQASLPPVKANTQ